MDGAMSQKRRGAVGVVGGAVVISIWKRRTTMQPVIEKASGGTWLVRSEPIPFGKTAADVSVVVQKYGWGWFCSVDRGREYRLPDCSHILAVQAMEFEIAQDNSDFVNHDYDRDEGLSGRADKDLTDPFDPLELGGE